MPRIVGVDIPNQKRIEAALQYIYGVCPLTAKLILAEAEVDPDKRAQEEEISKKGEVSK